MKMTKKSKVVLVGASLKNSPFAELKENLRELEDLALAAGLEVVATTAQVLGQWHPATLLGSGKIQEIRDLAVETKAELVIVDHQLTGGQARNMEQEIGVPVLDRAQLILSIFAQRAQTYEGKLQVELAQMLDQMPRMVNAWMGSLSRQGGGIGTRGPGETALENDRRRIKERVSRIRRQLEMVRQNRLQHRSSRARNSVPSFAMIGYTNAGKSSLLNRLTNANVLVKDQVFATLDPKTRKVFLENQSQAVVTDTVGFIRNLPPQLIEAFKATLEESAEADILLHVIDLSNPQFEKQVSVVNALVKEFGWDSKPIIYVYNKIDEAPLERQFQVRNFPRVFVSCKTGEGIDKLKKIMGEEISRLQEEVELFFPRSQEFKIFELGRETQITKTEKASQGTVCKARMTPTLISRWKDFLTAPHPIAMV